MAGITKAQRIAKEAKRILSENADKSPYELFIAGELTDEQFKAVDTNESLHAPTQPHPTKPQVTETGKMKPVLVEQKPIAAVKPNLLGQPDRYHNNGIIWLHNKKTGNKVPMSARAANKLIAKEPKNYGRG